MGDHVSPKIIPKQNRIFEHSLMPIESKKKKKILEITFEWIFIQKPHVAIYAETAFNRIFSVYNF